ncbi:hypothetical protein LTR10_005726 [Elasticomyces elasticus]|nr:hypothetical protein LTR10_005726 [Elasticomyces elasticus]KAK4964934.1 hypothetical protein LTR42_012351 [Elasticomyces elasticus]
MAPVKTTLFISLNATLPSTNSPLQSTPNNYDHISDMHNILFVCLSIATTILVACWQNRREHRQVTRENDRPTVELDGLAINRSKLFYSINWIPIVDTTTHIQSGNPNPDALGGPAPAIDDVASQQGQHASGPEQLASATSVVPNTCEHVPSDVGQMEEESEAMAVELDVAADSQGV